MSHVDLPCEYPEKRDSHSVMPADGSVTASDLKSVKGIELSKEILGTITAELDVKFLGGLLKRARYYG